MLMEGFRSTYSRFGLTSFVGGWGRRRFAAGRLEELADAAEPVDSEPDSPFASDPSSSESLSEGASGVLECDLATDCCNQIS
jgi:hypothetical protein